jgi:hypothetical protein
MTALISAELLRLRTVRGPRYGALGVLAFLAITAGLNVHSIAGRESPAELVDSLLSLALPGVLMAGALAATNVATEFQRGSVAITYLSHPNRVHVGVARALAYAGLGSVFAAVAALLVAASGTAVAGDLRLSAIDLARMIGGAAFGGTVMGAAGALIGTTIRNPTIASSVLPGWYVVEFLLIPAGTRPYLPFGLVNSLMGAAGDIPILMAIGLLLGYLAALALIVRRWALPRDLT